MMLIQYSEQAKKQLRKIEKEMRERILKKVRWYRLQDDPIQYAEILRDSDIADYRFRVGNYRVFFNIEKGEVSIIEVVQIRKRNERTYKN